MAVGPIVIGFVNWPRPCVEISRNNAWCMESIVRGSVWCSGSMDRYEKVLRTLQSRGAFSGDLFVSWRFTRKIMTKRLGK